MQVIPGSPHAGSNRISVMGRGGLLRRGGRVVTELGRWSAEALPDGTLRITAHEHDPDPYWWERREGGGLVLDLDFGRDGIRGAAELVASDPPVIDIRQEA